MTTTTTYPREIVFDRESRDFAAYADGNLIGFYPNHHAAEVALDQHIYDLLDAGLIGEIDGEPAEQPAPEPAPIVSIPPDESKPVPKRLYVIYDAAIERFICRWRQDDEDSGGYTSYSDFASCQKLADWIHFPVIYFGPAELAGGPDVQPVPDAAPVPFGNHLTGQASDLLTRLIAEKSSLLHSPPATETPDARRDRQERIARLTGCIERAGMRLGRRFLAMPTADPYAAMEQAHAESIALAPLTCACGQRAIVVDVMGATCGACTREVNWGS